MEHLAKMADQVNSTDQQQIAEHLRTKGVTKCPTAALIRTGVLIPAADRTLLRKHQEYQDYLRDVKERLFKQGPIFYSINKIIPFIFGGSLTFWPILI